jgi:UDP-N-acetyl-2-amino-2-deoxyglucuronate dehydrogenase
MTQQKHRLAIIGLGMALEPHLSSLRELANRIEIAAAWSPNTLRRNEAGKKFNLPIVNSLEEILHDESIDSALILTPPITHMDLVILCAAAKKHVLLEKPTDVSLERAMKSVLAMERAGRKFGIVLQHRFRAPANQLRELIDNCELGELIAGFASIRWWRPQSYYAQLGRGTKERDGGGVLLTQAIHTLDLFQSLTGPISHVCAKAVNSGIRPTTDTEDLVVAAIGFKSGAIGSIDATTLAFPGFPERIELSFTKATALIMAENLDVYFHDGRTIHIEGGVSLSGGSNPMAFSNKAHKELIIDFYDAIDTNRQPRISGRESLRVQEIIEALLQSSNENKEVELKLQEDS